MTAVLAATHPTCHVPDPHTWSTQHVLDALNGQPAPQGRTAVLRGITLATARAVALSPWLTPGDLHALAAGRLPSSDAQATGDSVALAQLVALHHACDPALRRWAVSLVGEGRRRQPATAEHVLAGEVNPSTVMAALDRTVLPVDERWALLERLYTDHGLGTWHQRTTMSRVRQHLQHAPAPLRALAASTAASSEATFTLPLAPEDPDTYVEEYWRAACRTLAADPDQLELRAAVVAAHPHSPDTIRSHALKQATRRRLRRHEHDLLTAIAQQGLTHAGAVLGQTPVPWLRGVAPHSLSGQMLTHYLAGTWLAPQDPAAARAVLGLYPTFTGTLAELYQTADGIADTTDRSPA